MPYRVGITTDEERRRAEWEKAVVGFTHWTIQYRGLSRESADRREKEIAEQYGCEHFPGGRDPNDKSATWSVYSFSYDRVLDSDE